MALRFRGNLLREGVETSDHRIILPGATRWRTLPLDFRAVFEDGWGGHENATPVAIIETIVVNADGTVYADGPLIIGDECADRYANLNVQGALRGVSVDLTGGMATIEIVNAETGEVLPEEVGMDILWGPDGDDFYAREVWSDAEIGAATAVGTPAFADCLIEVYDDATTPDLAPPGAAAPAVPAPAPSPVAAAASGGATAAQFETIDAVQIGDEVTWTDANGADQSGSITDVNTATEEVTVDPGDGNVATLPVADVTLVEENPTPDDSGGGIPAPAYAGRFPALAARTSARPHLASLLARERGDVITASADMMTGAVVTASVAWDDGPPRAAFERKADGPTPFTIEDDGTCYGHLCLWGQCHTGFAGAVLEHCLMPESSPSHYALFHASGQVRCSDGTRPAVGVISMDTGHAPAGRPGQRPSAGVVRAHYDHTGTQAMNVHVVDDEFGVWACGAVAAGVSVEKVRRAMASKPSGDWRNYGQGLDLMGVLMVNVAGYPVYEVEDGDVTLLVASLSPPADFVGRPASSTAAASTCGCGGTCCGGAKATAAADAHAAQAEPIRFPNLRVRALDHVMSGTAPEAPARSALQRMLSHT